jgi:hypothetical protein
MELRVFRLSGGVKALGVALVLAALLSWAASAQASTVALKTTTCKSTKAWDNGLGPTYVEKLAVSGTTCGAGQSFIKAYNSCRLKSGGVSGHCRVRVDGLTCKEQRQSSPAEFIGVVTCTKPREVVDFTYTEFT